MSAQGHGGVGNAHPQKTHLMASSILCSLLDLHYSRTNIARPYRPTEFSPLGGDGSSVTAASLVLCIGGERGNKAKPAIGRG